MDLFLRFLGQFLNLLLSVLTFAIVARAIVSWFPIDRNNPLIIILNQVTEPVLAPLRKIIPTIGMIDITPLIALLLLQLLQGQVANLFR